MSHNKEGFLYDPISMNNQYNVARFFVRCLLEILQFTDTINQ